MNLRRKTYVPPAVLSRIVLKGLIGFRLAAAGPGRGADGGVVALGFVSKRCAKRAAAASWVGDQDQRSVAGEQRFLDRAERAGIERGEALVEDHDVGLLQDGAREE
jgi:hypothetical protein